MSTVYGRHQIMTSPDTIEQIGEQNPVGERTSWAHSGGDQTLGVFCHTEAAES